MDLERHPLFPEVTRAETMIEGIKWTHFPFWDLTDKTQIMIQPSPPRHFSVKACVQQSTSSCAVPCQDNCSKVEATPGSLLCIVPQMVSCTNVRSQGIYPSKS